MGQNCLLPIKSSKVSAPVSGGVDSAAVVAARTLPNFRRLAMAYRQTSQCANCVGASRCTSAATFQPGKLWVEIRLRSNREEVVTTFIQELTIRSQISSID